MQGWEVVGGCGCGVGSGERSIRPNFGCILFEGYIVAENAFGMGARRDVFQLVLLRCGAIGDGGGFHFSLRSVSTIECVLRLASTVCVP